MLKEITAWWAARMHECVPNRFRQFGSDPGVSLVLSAVDPDGGAPEVTLQQIRRGREQSCERFTLDDQGIAALRHRARTARRHVTRLRLPQASLLERRIVLPLAAERDLAAVVGHQIDALTPFRADEIFWRADLEDRDRAHGRVHVRLSVLPRAGVQKPLQALRDAGLPIAVLEVPRADGPLCRLEIDTAALHRQRRTRRGLLVGSGVCAALALAAVLLPFLLQALALAAVERQIAALRPDVAAVDALRRRIAEGDGMLESILAGKARSADALTVIGAVTAALPDDTYLSSLTLRQGHLVLAGQSAAAVRLIGALSSDPVLRDVAFDAPTTRGGEGKVDLFSIHADLAPPGVRAGP